MTWEPSIHLLINSANIYLLNTRYALSTVLGSADRKVKKKNKTNESPSPLEIIVQ